MPRANRYFVPGYTWHITHRCHKKEFLLKFLRDRKQWLAWLFEAKKRFGLTVLNYTVTRNHIHLLVNDAGNDAIPKAMQLIAGRVAQQYNQRKKRNGAFWEDRYHATAVDSGEHLFRCLVYIDLNMVRAGAVGHPRDWQTGGYREIHSPPARYRVIDHRCLFELLGFRDVGSFQKQHEKWVSEMLADNVLQRNAKWSGSIAVGSKDFVREFSESLVPKAGTREIVEVGSSYIVQETPVAYNAHFGAKKPPLRPNNTFIWNLSGQE